MNKLLKAGCLALYALAVAGTLGYLPQGPAAILQGLALLFLAAHVLELIFVVKYVRLYQGPLIVSVMLTLLFGLLHWMPLAKQHKGS